MRSEQFHFDPNASAVVQYHIPINRARIQPAVRILSILRHRPEEGSAFFFAMARGIKVFLMSPGKNSKRKLALFPAAFSAAKWRRFRRANSVA
jgi:hypothetical protein